MLHCSTRPVVGQEDTMQEEWDDKEYFCPCKDAHVGPCGDCVVYLRRQAELNGESEDEREGEGD